MAHKQLYIIIAAWLLLAFAFMHWVDEHMVVTQAVQELPMAPSISALR
jgi:hypothetical protein